MQIKVEDAAQEKVPSNVKKKSYRLGAEIHKVKNTGISTLGVILLGGKTKAKSTGRTLIIVCEVVHGGGKTKRSDQRVKL